MANQERRRNVRRKNERRGDDRREYDRGTPDRRKIERRKTSRREEEREKEKSEEEYYLDQVEGSIVFYSTNRILEDYTSIWHQIFNFWIKKQTIKKTAVL